jgi:transposase
MRGVNCLPFILEELMATSRPPDAKTNSLRNHGTLNPRPEAVKDEFFDPRDLVQVRYEMLRRVRTEGRRVSETAALFGVSRPTYYKVDADFERDGMWGLLPRKRGPKGGHKLTAEVVDALSAARAEEPTMETSSLVELVRERFGIEVHPRTVERALRRREKKPR